MTETSVSLAQRLRADETIVTAWSTLAVPMLAELLGRAGYPAVTLALAVTRNITPTPSSNTSSRGSTHTSPPPSSESLRAECAASDALLPSVRDDSSISIGPLR